MFHGLWFGCMVSMVYVILLGLADRYGYCIARRCYSIGTPLVYGANVRFGSCECISTA